MTATIDVIDWRTIGQYEGNPEAAPHTTQPSAMHKTTEPAHAWEVITPTRLVRAECDIPVPRVGHQGLLCPAAGAIPKQPADPPYSHPRSEGRTDRDLNEMGDRWSLDWDGPETGIDGGLHR